MYKKNRLTSCMNNRDDLFYIMAESRRIITTIVVHVPPTQAYTPHFMIL